MALQLDPQGASINIELAQHIKLETHNPANWIKGIHMCAVTDLLAVYSATDVSFFTLLLSEEKDKPSKNNLIVPRGKYCHD